MKINANTNIKRLAIALCGMLLQGCCFGCGAPLYPKTLIQIDPATGRIMRSSEMETSLVLGAIEAGVSEDGTKTLKVGTATQPALVYGEEAVGVMQEYANQQEKYNQILDTIGKNAIGQIEAVGGLAGQVLGGLAGLRASAAAKGDTATCAVVDALAEKAKELVMQAQASKVLLEATHDALGSE